MKLYCNGYNLFKQLNINQPILEELTQIFTFEVIRQVCINQSHTLLATDEGYLLYQDRKVFNLNKLYQKEIVLVDSTDDYLIILDSKGKVTRVNFGDSSIQDISYKEIKNFNVLSVKIISGPKLIVAYLTDGIFFKGHQKLAFIHNDIVDIQCGKEHCLLLDKSGQVYSFGAGRHGQLGHGKLDEELEPQLIEGLAGIKIKKICAGGWHSCAISEDGDLYTWGWNSNGQLGLGKEGEDDHFVSVMAFPHVVNLEEDNLNVTLAACGSRHTIVFLDHKMKVVSLYPLSICKQKRNVGTGKQGDKRSQRDKKKSTTGIFKKKRMLRTCKGFLRLFRQMQEKLKFYRGLKYDASTNILELLDKIIPMEYFGTNQNRKLFYFVVKRIITRSRHECVFKSILYRGYDIGSMKWISEIKKAKIPKWKTLLNANVCILEQIVHPLVRHFNIATADIKSYEIKFYSKKKWREFQGQVFKILKERNHLIEGEFKKARGDLRIFPKSNLNSLKYRPVMFAYTSKTDKFFQQNISRKLRSLAVSYNNIGKENFYSYWRQVTDKISNDQVLYGIKLDLQDAFGNVNIQVLRSAITDTKNLTPQEKEKLIFRIENQFVLFNKKIYKWNHGLLQGDPLSAALCELYLSYVESKHLKEIFNTTSQKIPYKRYVDDYFYCSTVESDIGVFENKLLSMFPINESKTERANGDQNLTFSGHKINFKDRNITKLYKCKAIRHRFKFWNEKRTRQINSLRKAKADIVKSAILFKTTNHCFLKMYLDTHFNSEKMVLTSFYKGMLYVAFKFDFAVRAVKEECDTSKDLPFLIKIIESSIGYYARKIYRIILKSKGKHFKENISIKLLRNISYRAYCFALKTNTKFYKPILDQLTLKRNLDLDLKSLSHIAHVFTKLPTEFRNMEHKRKFTQTD